MEIFLEFLFWLIVEFLLSIGGEILVELGLRSIAEPFQPREERNDLLAILGYALLGLIVGALSLLVFPHPFVSSTRLHGISLLITPTLAGLVMAAIGWWRERKGKTVIRLDSFLYGFVFAFFMAAVRFLFTTF
jgi:uncharacterized membrane protein